MRELLPRLVLSALLLIAGILAIFESVYLRSQTAEFSSARIAAWARIVLALVFVLLGCSVAIAVA